MISARGLHLIERQIVRDGRSLLQYIGEAFPYTPARDERARARIEELAREEQQAIGQFVRFLHKHHITPQLLGAFQSNFTTINFVSLDYLVPALLKDQETAIADLERGLAALPEDETRHLLWGYLEMKKRHRHTLSEIATGVLKGPVAVEPARPAH